MFSYWWEFHALRQHFAGNQKTDKIIKADSADNDCISVEIHSKNLPSLKWSSYQLLIIFSTIISSIHVLAEHCTLIFNEVSPQNKCNIYLQSDSECKSREQLSWSFRVGTASRPPITLIMLGHRNESIPCLEDLSRSQESLSVKWNILARPQPWAGVAPRLKPPQAQNRRRPQIMITRLGTWTSVGPEALSSQSESQWHWAWARA